MRVSNLFCGVVAVLLVGLVALSSAQQPPIPPTYDGYTMKPVQTPLWLEAYYDFLCPDSAASFPIIQSVLNYYGSNIFFTLHVFPLPYHHNAFLAAKAGAIVAGYNPALIWPWVELIFQNQSIYYNSNAMNMSQNDVQNSLAAFVEANLNIPQSYFLNQMNNNETLEYNVRVSWKLGANRGVFGTPEFFLNGVLTEANQTWTTEDWFGLIDQVLAGLDPSLAKKRFY